GRRVARERDEAHRRMPYQAIAGRNAVPGHDLEDALREDLLRQLDEAQHRQRRLLGRLDDLDVAGGERRAHLPDDHEERVVPGRYPGDDAERLAADHRGVALDVLGGGLALEVPRRAGEEAEVVRHHAGLVDGDPPRLADVPRLESRELLGVLVDHVGEPEQELHPVLRRLLAPCLPRPLGRGDRAVDVLLSGPRHLRDDLARRRIQHLHRLAREGVDELAVDEHLLLRHRNAHESSFARCPTFGRAPTSGPERIAGRRGISARRPLMRILVVGTGGVGSAFAAIAARRTFFEHCALADYDAARPAALVASLDDGRFSAHRIDASSRDAVSELIRETRPDAVLNAVDPVFNVPVFDACFEAGVTYLDMAMTLSEPHAEKPYELTGVKLGDYQFERAAAWEEKGLLALVGIGIEPGAADVFARHAADELFSEIDEVGVRDGASLVVEGYDFAPTFSIWTTIEECLNPPVIWEHERGWFTTEPFSEPETFDFPEGIGPVECVNVEHEEVLLVPRWVDCRRVTFKYGLGDEFIEVLKTLHRLGLDRTAKVKVGGAEVSPRDVV